MWTVLTYIYNSILIIFIAAHLLVGAIICFGVGLYTGIYLSQNYQIPRINEPYNLWEKFIKSLEQLRKPRKESQADESSSAIELDSLRKRNTERETKVNKDDTS